jgi:hypothetical protein
VYERLLEGWLDSAGERTYQGPFCQVLAADGYTVLHSTRHAAIEFGKDVIAIAPDGMPCAYQLKGNPGGRLTLAQFREIQPQLWQLGTQRIVFPGLPEGPHRSFLVSNGGVDEEVQRSIDDMNKTIVAGSGSPIEIIQRGQLLALFGKHVAEFWPSEIPELSRVFRLLAADGNEQPPLELLHEVLCPMLLLEGHERERVPAPELRRRVTSSALVIAVCMRSFSIRENHYALLAAWTLYATYVCAACVRYGHDPADLVGASVAVAQDTILRRLLDLAEEASRRRYHVEGHPLVDTVVYRGRRSLVAGLVSVLWLWCQRAGAWPLEGIKEKVEAVFEQARKEMELWGEGAVPQFLASYWFARASSADVAPDGLLIQLVTAVTNIVKQGDKAATLSSPYYSFEEVRRHQLAVATGAPDPWKDDSPRAASFFAESLFHLLVRTGLKQTCKSLWPALTRISIEGFEPEHPWGFCLWRTARGTSTTRLLMEREGAPASTTYEGKWSDVVERARHIGTPEVPGFIRERPELLLLFAIVCPYRATPNVVRYLGRVFNEGWFLEAPIDEAVPRT